MYLQQKNPDGWSVIEDGAWGKMMFKPDSFVFNGHKLESEEKYTLIRYLDPWPGSVVCLASGQTNEYGDINLKGEMEKGGPKVWLVLTDDVDCNDTLVMTGWHPDEYLFEHNLIDGEIYVAFLEGAIKRDSWWMTIDGVHYERRIDGYFQFHPVDATCEYGYSASFNWTFNDSAYEELEGDVGNLADFLTSGHTYHVCRYAP